MNAVILMVSLLSSFSVHVHPASSMIREFFGTPCRVLERTFPDGGFFFIQVSSRVILVRSEYPRRQYLTRPRLPLQCICHQPRPCRPHQRPILEAAATTCLHRQDSCRLLKRRCCSSDLLVELVGTAPQLVDEVAPRRDRLLPRVCPIAVGARARSAVGREVRSGA